MALSSTDIGALSSLASIIAGIANRNDSPSGKSGTTQPTASTTPVTKPSSEGNNTSLDQILNKNGGVLDAHDLADLARTHPELVEEARRRFENKTLWGSQDVFSGNMTRIYNVMTFNENTSYYKGGQKVGEDSARYKVTRTVDANGKPQEERTLLHQSPRFRGSADSEQVSSQPVTPGSY